ncbi:hypothetical protein HPB51_025542 [Rhipicephalus microplus]|uniref:THAP-type domain-containing protein n=1 Tax=Rhipicephalus microplus TaxID=6941 RepID=A0A9J6F8L6_RHIMP|nr:hypothetical protein HPB51_025542 [Rhipicephalus microplus]
MPYCCVPYCKSRSKKKLGVSFHEFSADQAIQQKLPKAISRKVFIPNDKSASSVVCSLHFVGDDYSSDSPKRRRLKRTAVPSVFPGYPTYIQPQIPQKRRNLEREQPPCAVPTMKVVLCTVNSDSVEDCTPSGREGSHQLVPTSLICLPTSSETLLESETSHDIQAIPQSI